MRIFRYAGVIATVALVQIQVTQNYPINAVEQPQYQVSSFYSSSEQQDNILSNAYDQISKSLDGYATHIDNQYKCTDIIKLSNDENGNIREIKIYINNNLEKLCLYGAQATDQVYIYNLDTKLLDSDITYGYELSDINDISDIAYKEDVAFLLKQVFNTDGGVAGIEYIDTNKSVYQKYFSDDGIEKLKELSNSYDRSQGKNRGKNQGKFEVYSIDIGTWDNSEYIQDIIFIQCGYGKDSIQIKNVLLKLNKDYKINHISLI